MAFKDDIEQNAARSMSTPAGQGAG